MSFHRPSLRRLSQSQDVTINLIPILDTMVTLISFLLISGAFVSLVVLDSPVPLLASPEKIEALKSPPLLLTLHIREDGFVLEGGLGNVVNRQIALKSNGQLDMGGLHAALVEIKAKFPSEKQLILMPRPHVSYETLIQTMDAARFYEKTDPTLFQTDPSTGREVPQTGLFPEIVFGNILSLLAIPTPAIACQTRSHFTT